MNNNKLWLGVILSAVVLGLAVVYLLQMWMPQNVFVIIMHLHNTQSLCLPLRPSHLACVTPFFVSSAATRLYISLFLEHTLRFFSLH